MSEEQNQIKAIREYVSNIQHCMNNKCGGVEQQFSAEAFRGLMFEEKRDSAGRGCIVVGINPSRQILEPNTKWGRITPQNWTQVSNENFYNRAREIIVGLNLAGPILWTELVKCPSDAKSALPPLDTFRKCVSTFLSKEIRLVPSSWPILALGRESFKASAYLFPRRLVIGVPHPTGAAPQFHHLFKMNESDPGRSLKPIFVNWFNKSKDVFDLGWWNGIKDQISKYVFTPSK